MSTQQTSEAPKPRPKSTVIVVGGGLAGMSACIEAIKSGADVVLLDKNPNLGGNSALASSGMNATHTKAQTEANISDSFESFIKDTMESGGRINNGQLVNILVNESPEAVTFLQEHGIDLSVVVQCGGHSAPRTHRQKPNEAKVENVGWHIVGTLMKYLQSLPHHQMRIINNAKVDRLLLNNEKAVVGVHFTTTVEKTTSETNLFADAVILSTGGYSADYVLMEEFGATQWIGYPTTNGAWAVGDGVKLCRQIGAELIDMDKIQLHPTGIVDLKEPFAQKKFLAPEAFRGYGGILLNSLGQRFCNELGPRDYVTEQILKFCQSLPVKEEQKASLNPTQRIPTVSYLVLTDEIAKLFDLKLFGFYKGKGLISSFANYVELATMIGCDAEVLKKTLLEYNKCREDKKDSFGKKLFEVAFNPDEALHVVVVTPSIHYTMGGVRISDRAEVLRKDNSPILGLYAAGEVTGGVHGKNRLGGNSLLECVVFGRRAGSNAIKYAQSSAIAHHNTIATRPSFVDDKGVLHETVLSPDKFIALRLRQKVQVNKTNFLFTFDLPKPTDQIGLLAGQYIAVKAFLDGEDVVRYYSPVSRNSEYGKIDLLIKIEPEKGNFKKSMCNYLSNLLPGNTLDFKGPLGGFEYHRNAYRAVGMIAGGTGISPMVQIIRSVIAHPEDKTQLTLLYGNYFEDDILCKEEIMYYHGTRDNVKVYMTLNNPPPHWKLGTGFITEDMIKTHLPAPANDIKIVLCGPPVMIKVMIPILKKVGYTDQMIFSFI